MKGCPDKYSPGPIDTSGIVLPEEISEPSGLLSKNVHEVRSARHGAAPAKNIAVKDSEAGVHFLYIHFSSLNLSFSRQTI